MPRKNRQEKSADEEGDITWPPVVHLDGGMFACLACERNFRKAGQMKQHLTNKVNIQLFETNNNASY